MGFFPNEDLWHDGYVNLWQGWGVEPKEGTWTMFQNHIKNVLCDGNEKLYTFVLDWCADIVQDPMEPKGTAIVLHGKEGTGKGTFCYMLGQIIGQKHYKHVTNERHLTGNFNYHLMDGLLIFADEVVYGGDRKTAGILKSLVTEKELVCERKGIDSFMFENRARLVVASNEDWFIPAGPESRRWLVLDVNDRYANDRQYFDLMYKQMLEEGGCAAMMRDLLDRKITSNLNKAIETKALEAQRAIYKSTGDAVDIWMDECIGKADLGVIDEGQGGWPDDMDRQLLYEAFIKWAKEMKIRTKGVAHFYRKVESYGFVKHRPRTEGVRKWRYKVPPHDAFTTED
jgi:phage/plasmid-associated DNA primase